MNDDWLNQLKEGDEVVVRSRYRSRIDKVTRITPTQIIIGKDSRFSKKRGRLIDETDSWYRTDLRPVTDDWREKINRTDALEFIEGAMRNGNLAKIPCDGLELIVLMIHLHNSEQEKAASITVEARP